MFRLSQLKFVSSSSSPLVGARTIWERRISLASFRFPRFGKQSTSDVALNSSVLPTSVKPWHGSDNAVLQSSYPAAPRIASVDFPITKHERYVPDRVQHFKDWDYDTELVALCARLRLPMAGIGTLRQALTHPSFLLVLEQEQADGDSGDGDVDWHNYSQLSCYGRAASQLFVVEHLHYHFPNLPAEGINELAKHLLQEQRLAFVAHHLGALDLIQRSTQNIITADDHAVLSEVFYAMVGTLLTADSVAVAQSFVDDYVVAQLQEENLDDTIRFEQPKLLLRHLLREQHKPAPVARLLNDAGHNTPHSVYHIAVYCGKTVIGKGFGRTLESGEEEACRDAVREFFLTELRLPKSL